LYVADVHGVCQPIDQQRMSYGFTGFELYLSSRAEALGNEIEPVANNTLKVVSGDHESKYDSYDFAGLFYRNPSDPNSRGKD